MERLLSCSIPASITTDVSMSKPTDRASHPSRVAVVFFFQAEDGIRDLTVTGVQTCALPISKLAGAVQGGNLEQMAQANAALTAPLGRLLAIAENYPQLKSNENFRALQDQLEGTENRIAVARQDYNDAVNRYNAYIRRFPQVLTAKLLGKGPRP